jgi:hypothetical protein
MVRADSSGRAEQVMMHEGKGLRSTFDRGYIQTHAPEPVPYERTTEQKAADAATIADNFDHQRELVRASVAEMRTTAIAGDRDGWTAARRSAEQALQQLEHLAKRAPAAAQDATDTELRKRLASAKQLLEDAEQLVAGAPTAPPVAAPELSCSDDIMAVLPPDPPPATWRDPDFQAAADAVAAVCRCEMTISDIAAFRTIVTRHADHAITRRFRQFGAERRRRLLGLLDKDDVKRSARAREAARRAEAADRAGQDRASADAQADSDPVTPIVPESAEVRATERPEERPAMQTGVSGAAEPTQLDAAPPRETLGPAVAARVPGVTYEGTGRFLVATGERSVMATVQRVHTGVARVRRGADDAAVLDIPTGVDENELAAAVAAQLRALQLQSGPQPGTPASGAPLPVDVRADMEHALQADFSGVRVHQDGQAEAVGALAFTRGADIHFAPGHYDPHSPQGRQLLGHELTHVAQQGQGRVPPTTQINGQPTNDDPALEHEADRKGVLAASTTASAAVPTAPTRPAPGPTLQAKAPPPPDGPTGARPTTSELAADIATPIQRQRDEDKPTKQHTPHATQTPAGSPGAPLPLPTFSVERWLGISLEMTPAIASGEPAIVGMQLQFNLRRSKRPGMTVIVGQWELTYPSGRVDRSPSLEVIRLPITEAGAYVMRAKLIAEHDGGGRQEAPIERQFTAVSAATRAQDLLPAVADNSYEELRGPLDIQRALLRPPGPAAQASGDYRIDTAAANPAAATDRGPPLVYSIARAASTPAPSSQSYQWYARPLTRETLPQHRNGTRALGNLRAATLDGQSGFFDLGTGATAELVSDEHNVFVIVCRVLDASGQRISEARYVQTVLNERERHDLGELEAHMDRSAALARVLSPATRAPLTAIHVAIDSATTTRLQLFAGPMDHGIAIIDVTPGLSPKQHQFEYEGATFADALASFRARNHHARGSIRLRVPERNHLSPNGAAIAPAEHTIETTGETQIETWSGRFGLASMALLAGAVVAAPFTGGSSVAVTLLLIGSAATGAAAAGLSLAERVQHAEISKTGVALDIVGVVTSIVGGAAAFRGLRAANQAINIAGQASRFVLWTNFVSAGVAAVLVSVECVEQIQQILSDDKLTPDQRRLLLIRVVTNMAMTGAVVAVSYHDLGNMRARLSARLGAELEGALGHEARLTLNLLDDDVLHAVRGPSSQPTTVAEVNRLVVILRAAPGLVRRLAGRAHLIDALRLARHDTANALELGFLRVRLAPAVGPAQAERIANALERAGVPGAVAHELGEPALLRISSDPERAAALYHQHGDRFLAEIQAHPRDALDTIAGRLGAGSPHAADGGVFELTNTRTLNVTGTSGASSTTVDGNLGPSHLNQDLRGMASKPRAHGATVTFDRRASNAVHSTTGRVTVTDASGTPTTVELEVRGTSNLDTPGGAAGPEPTDLQLLPPGPTNGRQHWQAKITLSNRLRRADVEFAVGREIDKAVEIVSGNRHRTIAADQQAVAFRPGGRMVTNAAQTSAADRATLQQLRDLWADLGKQKQPHSRQERTEQIQRLLRQMGLDDPERFARRLPLLRSMGMTDAEWKPIQVIVEQRAFAASPHPGITATQPIMTNHVIDHLLHPQPSTGVDFLRNGLYGGHQTSNLLQFVRQHPEFELIQTRTASSGGTIYREYRQYRWKSSSASPPPIGDARRPGGSAFGAAEQALWDVARVPKTAADGLQSYMHDAEAAWEQWRSARFNPGPPPSGPAAQDGRFTTPPNTAGVAFEGGYTFSAGPPPSWDLNTIYPKI